MHKVLLVFFFLLAIPTSCRKSPDYQGLVTQGRSGMLQVLYNSSDYVLEGIVNARSCWNDESGVQQCEYVVAVTRVHKGLPQIRKRDGYPVCTKIQARNDSTVALLMGHFTFGRDTSEKPYEVCDDLVLFMIDVSTSIRPRYAMTDRWLGAQVRTPYLSTQLEHFSNARR